MVFKFLLSCVVALYAALPVMAAPAEIETPEPPQTLTQHADNIWRALESASWVPQRDPSVPPNGKIVYAVSFRSCPTCAAFKAAEYEALMKAGVEVRWIMYARRDQNGKPRSKPGERSMVAALWLNRDAGLMERWWAADDLDAFYNASGLPPAADGDLQREGAVAQSRAFVDRLSGLLDDNQVDMAIPALFWREGAVTKVSIGYSAQGFAPARAFLTAPAN